MVIARRSTYRVRSRMSGTELPARPFYGKRPTTRSAIGLILASWTSSRGDRLYCRAQCRERTDSARRRTKTVTRFDKMPVPELTRD